MNNNTRTSQSPTWVLQTLMFFKRHYLIVLALGMAAAMGRVIQLGALGPISPVLHLALEIIIEGARLMIFVYALGLTNVRKGFGRIRQILTKSGAWKSNWSIAKTRLKRDWRSLLASMVIYLLIAWVINLLIDYTAYQTCLYYKLKVNSIISEGASEWVIILFFKNLSVIPLTLIFNALFLLWITGRAKN
ncbi:hypothetical protein LZD49_28475 [Dyadobacter sp. CY261]|uniref:hypothetical protein n=1 Tax=Dyadobacter sp. CY261 TaxID=2907203 RepID=UPI001F1D96F4|nr:hypothetical protein [Dyadobacter sp. CY261]MCF0074454.1 hypothetical protein [Dyadobacter sp. CY261]